MDFTFVLITISLADCGVISSGLGKKCDDDQNIIFKSGIFAVFLILQYRPVVT